MRLYKPSNIAVAILLEFGFAFLLLAASFILGAIVLKIF